MVRCNSFIEMEDNLQRIVVFQCQLDEHFKGKHKFEGMHSGKLYKIEWWDELPVIEGLTEMYVEERAIERGYKK